MAFQAVFVVVGGLEVHPIYRIIHHCPIDGKEGPYSGSGLPRVSGAKQMSTNPTR